MKLREFTELTVLSDASNLDKALALLWWSTRFNETEEVTASALAAMIKDNSWGNPNSSKLKESLKRSSLTITSVLGHKLNQRGLAKFSEMLLPSIGEIPITISVSDEYLPNVVWRDTRGYIERVSVQINGCFSAAFYDAALVMIRRLVETLLIESFEHSKIENLIKADDGHYKMLSEIASVALSDNTLKLSRESIGALKLAKLRGDRAAHNRRVNANRKDVEDLREPVNTLFKELLILAGIKK